MVYDKSLLNYIHSTIPLPVHNDTSDKHLGNVIGKNNKHIAFFFRILSNNKCNYTKMDK